MLSRAEQLAIIPLDQREAFLAALTEDEALQLLYDWTFLARPKQRTPPGRWETWLILAGRGFGKTRTGAEWVREKMEEGEPFTRMALVGRTAADVRDVIIEGESGIMSICPPWNMPTYEPSKRRVTWPNGSMAIAYSADKPDVLRGPQHHYALCDELAAWRYTDAWDQLQFGLRLGRHPQTVVATTPRPTELIRELTKDRATILTRGSTMENAANISRTFLKKVFRKYKGTRLGRQELDGEVLEDTEGALWTHDLIKRIDDAQIPKDLRRVVVAIDPAVTNNPNSSETGISCSAVDDDGRGIVLGDFSGKMSTNEWAERAVAVYDEYQADEIIGEVNNGGDLVENVIRSVRRNINYRAVHASRGKFARAEPVSALYEQKKVVHAGTFKELEEQMTTYVPGLTRKSPDRMDALVWGLTALMVEDAPTVEPVELFIGTKEAWQYA